MLKGDAGTNCKLEESAMAHTGSNSASKLEKLIFMVLSAPKGFLVQIAEPDHGSGADEGVRPT
jgi:hypothetical protein